MSQLSIYLNDNVMQELKKISIASGKAISKVAAEFIENGIKLRRNHQNLNDNTKMNEYEKKHHVSMIVALNLVIEILKKIRNEPSQYDDKKIEYMLACFKNFGYESINDL